MNRQDFVEVIKRCPYCSRENPVPSHEYAENPFCNVCLNERLAKANSDMPATEWKYGADGYAELIPATERAA
ncbi:MAG: hypothetical protein ACREA9_23275 [Pyrinomonadaceae bacterium]